MGRETSTATYAISKGLGRPASAEHIGVSPTKFDQMVADGRMPRPKRIDGRVVWDRDKLDEAFDALPDDGDRRPCDETEQ